LNPGLWIDSAAVQGPELIEPIHGDGHRRSTGLDTP
jgi:hypothetical protein